MKWLKFCYLGVGVGVLAFVLGQSDLHLVWETSLSIGIAGLAAVLVLYFLAFLIDTASWQFTFVNLGTDSRWLYRLWKVRMVGEAFNNSTPLGSMGGEPVKAAILKKTFGVRYDEGIASLFLARTTNLIALIAFLAVGLALILISPQFNSGFKLTAGIGLVALAVGTAGFFLVQRYRMMSKVGTALSKHRWGRRLIGILESLQSFEQHLVLYYTGHEARFPKAVALAFLNWLLGMAEIYVIMRLLDSPVSVWDAWIIEAAVQLTRAATFFVPLAIGTQEGALFLITVMITGNGSIGLAVSLIKRAREVLWILWGFAVGWTVSFRPGMLAESRDAD